MTPYELNLFVSDFNDKQKLMNEEKLTLTWLGAYWHRVEKLQPLKEILGKQHVQKQQMTNDEMFNMVKNLNSAFDGTTF
jgi:hypothetical protein